MRKRRLYWPLVLCAVITAQAVLLADCGGGGLGAINPPSRAPQGFPSTPASPTASGTPSSSSPTPSGAPSSPTPSPRRSPVASSTPSPTETPSAAPTRSPTPAPSRTADPTPTPTPTRTPTPTPTRTPTPTPTPTLGAKHVLTFTTLGYDSFVNWNGAAQWTTWAEIPAQIAASVAGAGIKTIYYTDPNRQAPTDYLYTNDESTFAHDCSGNRILTRTYAQYVMAPQSENLAALWHQLVSSRMDYGPINAVFEDNAGGLDAYGSDLPTMPCNYDEGSWTAADEEMETDLGYPVIYNGLSSLNGHGVSTSIALNATAFGGMFEHCYANNNARPKEYDWVWRATEDTEIQMAEQHKLFICLAKDTSPAYTSADGRRYALASFLLTFDLATSVFGEQYTTGSNFEVLPETQLVPTNPVISLPTDISGLMTSSGVYAREYQSCYLRGNWVGKCAIVVNPDYFNSHAFPFSSYHHTLQINGSDVFDGGSVSANGGDPPTTMSPLEAVIAFQ